MRSDSGFSCILTIYNSFRKSILAQFFSTVNSRVLKHVDLDELKLENRKLALKRLI